MTGSNFATGQRRLDAAMLNGEPSAWLPRVSTLLDEQCRLCEGLDKLSVAQSQAVQAGNSDALLRVLGERQVLVDRVGEINAELEAFRGMRDRAMGRLSDEQRRGVQAHIERIAMLVDGVCARDEADRLRLEQDRQRVASELGGLSRGHGAVRAYGAGGMSAPAAVFQDRQG